MEVIKDLAVTAVATIILAAIAVGIVHLVDLVLTKWKEKKDEDIMKRLGSISTLLNSVMGIVLELGMYVCFIAGKLSFYQLIVGFCLLQITGCAIAYTRKAPKEEHNDDVH